MSFLGFKIAQIIIFAYANEPGGSKTIIFSCANRLVDLQICPNPYICLRKSTFWGVELLKTIIFACANEFDRWPQEDPPGWIEWRLTSADPSGSLSAHGSGQSHFFLVEGWLGWPAHGNEPDVVQTSGFAYANELLGLRNAQNHYICLCKWDRWSPNHCTCLFKYSQFF